MISVRDAGAIHQAVQQGDSVSADQFKAGVAELRTEIAGLDKRLSAEIAGVRTDRRKPRQASRHADRDRRDAPAALDGRGRVRRGVAVRRDSRRAAAPCRVAPADRRPLHVPRPRLNDVMLGRRSVSTDTALRLARYFGTRYPLIDPEAGGLPR